MGGALGPGKRLEILRPGKQRSFVEGDVRGNNFVPHLSPLLPARGFAGLTGSLSDSHFWDLCKVDYLTPGTRPGLEYAFNKCQLLLFLVVSMAALSSSQRN